MKGTRVLMGIGTLAVLIPALIFTVPGAFGDLRLGDGSEQETGTPAMTSSADGNPAALADGGTGVAASSASVVCAPAPCPNSIPPEGEVASFDPTVTTPDVPEESTTPTATTNIGRSDQEEDTDTTASRPETGDEPQDSTPTSPPTTAVRIVSESTISGNACPCTVTGTAELKGEVNLQGDVTVDGGTLVARPGVDVDGNGFQIMFMNGGKADFQGSSTSTWSGNGSNANISRDITFRNMRRIIWNQGGGKSTLRYFAVIDSGTPSLGDYPLHWHLNGNSVSGTIVEGVAVVNGRHHAFVPHGSHGITFKDTIAKNTRDSAYWWDPAGTNNCSGFRNTCTTDNSNNIVYDHALADGVRSMAGERGDRLAGFNLGAGSGNVIRNSVATDVAGGRDCAGFVWPEDANQNVGGTVWSFSGNASWSSNCHGAFTWQNDGSHHVINGFTGSGIGHGAYLNNYEYRNIDVPYIEVHAAGWKVVGGHIGTVITLKHRNTSEYTALLQDVAIDSFVIRNAVDSGEIPGIYVLNNTGLTCSDIQYESVVPGTRVVINGTDC